MVGAFKNAGQGWPPTGTPEPVLVHNFPGAAVGKAIPYGVYDMARNEAWVSVGRDHDTPVRRMRDLALHPHAFHGDWNYEPRPRPG